MERVNDEMLKHNINMLACLSFVWLKDYQRFMVKHIQLQTTNIITKK